MNSKAALIGGVPTIRIEKKEDLQGFKLIDVRGSDEFNGELGHIPGATLQTLGDDLESFLKSENKDTPIMFICRSGARSAAATRLARQMGFQEVYNMEGGMIYINMMGLK